MIRIFQIRRVFISLITLAFFAVAAPSPGHAGGDSARPQRIELAYNIYLGGLLAGSVDLRLESDGRHYSISSVARSHGLLDYLISFRRRNEVVGRFSERMAKPSTYAATGVWAGKTRSVQINYTAENELRFTAMPSALEDEREAVPPEQLPGTLDPFSAFYQAVLRHHAEGKCNGKSKVFDGRRRYDISFEAVGGRLVSGPLYNGAAQVCRVRQIPIAGFSQRVWLPRLVRPKWTDVWLVEVRDDSPALPVRLEADAGLGAMVAHLVAIGGRKYPPGEGPSEKAPQEEVASGHNPGADPPR